MLTTEVTAAQYQACASAGECDEASTGFSCTAGVAGKEQHPINCVTWYEAKAFCEWVEARLCTEAEWEYAARSGTNEWDYPWGDSAPDCSTNNKAVMSGCNCDGTCPVCSKTAGNSSQGVCDLAGNVWEWVEDCWHDGYTGALATGFPAWTTGCSGSYRVLRGGGWGAGDADGLRASNRGGDDPDAGDYDLGLRCCRSN
jgi:formylglycine-generating enzyme required for sulfatase activity